MPKVPTVALEQGSIAVIGGGIGGLAAALSLLGTGFNAARSFAALAIRLAPPTGVPHTASTLYYFSTVYSSSGRAVRPPRS
jgi:glycine/D-amino acid oxidase-like deaminating enzyme